MKDNKEIPTIEEVGKWMLVRYSDGQVWHKTKVLFKCGGLYFGLPTHLDEEMIKEKNKRKAQDPIRLVMWNEAIEIDKIKRIKRPEWMNEKIKWVFKDGDNIIYFSDSIQRPYLSDRYNWWITSGKKSKMNGISRELCTSIFPAMNNHWQDSLTEIID